MAARGPLARTSPADTASAQDSRPAVSLSQVAGSVSTTLGGVPRVCRGPAMHWTAAYGGTRTSTARPGTRSASTSRRYATDIRRDSRCGSTPASIAASAAAAQARPSAGLVSGPDQAGSPSAARWVSSAASQRAGSRRRGGIGAKVPDESRRAGRPEQGGRAGLAASRKERAGPAGARRLAQPVTR